MESISEAYATHATVLAWADMQSVAWVIVDWIHTDCEEGSLIPAVRRRLGWALSFDSASILIYSGSMLRLGAAWKRSINAGEV